MSLALHGQMKWSDWRKSGRVGWSLILFGSLRLPHVLDRDYDRPARHKKPKKLEMREKTFEISLKNNSKKNINGEK